MISHGCTFDISGQGKFRIEAFYVKFAMLQSSLYCIGFTVAYKELYRLYSSSHIFKMPLCSPNGLTGQHVVKRVKKAFKLEHELVQHNVRVSIPAN